MLCVFCDSGVSLNLSNKLLTSSARTRYMQHLSSVSKTTEQASGEYRLRYARLRPTSGNYSQFARFILYLVKSQCVRTCHVAIVLLFLSILLAKMCYVYTNLIRRL